MNDTIFNANFKSFLEAISGQYSVDYPSPNCLPELILLSDLLHIGRACFTIDSPATTYTPEGLDRTAQLYTNSAGYDDREYRKKFTTGDRGELNIIIQPTPGYEWNAWEYEKLDSLIYVLYIFFGRSRLAGLVERAENTDHMTGLLNASGLNRKYVPKMSAGLLYDYYGLYINIKNFKWINDRVGPRVGDKFLRMYSSYIQNLLQPGEDIARLGGDNFFALIHSSRVNEFLKAIRKIPLSDTTSHTKKTFEISSRVGICPTANSDAFSDVLNLSHIALMVAKTSTTSQDVIWYNKDMRIQTMHDKEVSLLFPQALAKREFVVYYQPKINLENESFCGAEALVRWVQRGKIIQPLDFIPVLEREGSICDLDFYVLRNVCQDLNNWIELGIKPPCVSVNFSKVHLHDENLASNIYETVKEYSISPELIEIELTESSSYEDFDALSRFITRIKEYGFHVSIDDFGKGYSSLKLIKTIPIDVIKLDRSLLSFHEATQDKDRIVLQNTIQMISELGIKTLAEGVETEEQASLLREFNCHMAQGFLYDRPLPYEQFERRLRSDQ